MNHHGQVLYSCNRILSVDSLIEVQQRSIMDQFPLLESIFAEVLQLKPGQTPLLFQGVEAGLDGKPSYFDFGFQCLTRKPDPLVLWQIYDKTNYYLEFRARQQAKHEELIRQDDKKKY